MVCGQRLSIVVSREQDIIPIQVCQRNICRIPLFGMNEHMARLRFQTDEFKHLAKSDPFPGIVKSAPARDAMEITYRFDLWKQVELLPGEADRNFNRSPDTEIPGTWIKTRDRTIVQDRPFQCERLPRRQAPGIAHIALSLFALVAGEKAHRIVVHARLYRF